MRSRTGSLAVGVMLAFAVAGVTPAAASTATVTNNGISLTHPSYPVTGPALVSCEPWQDPLSSTIRLTGIPEGANVTVYFAWSPPTSGTPTFLPPLNYREVAGGALIVPVSYPTETSAWPVVQPPDDNERSIGVAAIVAVTHQGTTTKINSRKWWVRCPALPAPAQGCAHGFWRQPHRLDSWVGYTPNQLYGTVFGVTPTFAPNALIDALWLGGGGLSALARAAVAALLNAAHPGVNYPYTVAQVISMVQAAHAPGGNVNATRDAFQAANDAGCPIN